MNIVNALTDFGDLAVLLPLVAAVSIWLLWRSPKDAAPWWLLAVAVCAGVTAALKILFYGCPPAADLRSPSGHASLSALVYGALVVLAAARATQRQRLALIAIGTAAILAIAASRVALHDHTIAEAISGLAIGAAALAIFVWRFLSRPPLPSPVWPLLVPAAFLVVVLHGDRLRAAEFFNAIGAYVQENALKCG